MAEAFCESCSCTSLSPKLHCARLGRSRALGLRNRFARGAALLQARNNLSERWGIVEAKAAAISTLGVAGTFTAGRRSCDGWSPKLCAALGRLAAGSFVERRRRAGDLLQRRASGRQRAVGVCWLRCAEAGDKPSSVRRLRWKRSARRERRSGRGFCDFVPSVWGHTTASTTGLSPKLHCARLGRSRALGLRNRFARGAALLQARNNFERALGHS